MAQFTVKTYYKKSCEQHEHFLNSKIPGAKIIVKDGFRFAEFTVETSDDQFPEFDFTQCPGGSNDPDSVNLFDCFGDNVESTELVEMFDGGCWGDIEIEGIDDEDEEERLRELIEEEGAYALEEDGDGDWYLDETECWVWGPLEVTDEEGNSRIVVADEDGNMIDFVEE
jgi:catechol 2,3-dioxygenase-like lactoylglutathione lyase family enzyme